MPETAEGMSEQLPSVGGEKMAEEVMVKKAQPPVMAPSECIQISFTKKLAFLDVIVLMWCWQASA